jgi:hypothetical protein
MSFDFAKMAQSIPVSNFGSAADAVAMCAPL